MHKLTNVYLDSLLCISINATAWLQPFMFFLFVLAQLDFFIFSPFAYLQLRPDTFLSISYLCSHMPYSSRSENEI